MKVLLFVFFQLSLFNHGLLTSPSSHEHPSSIFNITLNKPESELQFSQETNPLLLGQQLSGNTPGFILRVGIIIISGLLIFLIYKNLRQIKKKNKQLEAALEQLNESNARIRSSISYAKRIQQAMLSNEEDLRKLLPESFIFFKPKEKVSGDFYWFKKIIDPQTGNPKFIISAIDCTGHGVPGALMSMIGYNFLNEIIGSGIIEADKILNELHRKIRSTLKQEATNLHDGMEAALCVLDFQDNTLEFAGAKNPLVIINNGTIKKLKGDNSPIGGIQKENQRLFHKKCVPITENMVVYLFSDGFQDQFGGNDGKKFMVSRFVQLLYEIHHEPSETQKALLEEKFEGWIGNENFQIDDVLVLGFKLNKPEPEGLKS